MWLFGGYDGDYRQDAWALPFADHPTRWTPVVAVGMTPEARLLHSAVYDPVRDRVLVFGGEFHSRRFNDTWAFRWTPQAATGPGDHPVRPQASPMAAPRTAARPVFALHAVAPNPIVGEMTVRFTLEDDHPASLELFSVAGQQVFRRDLAGLGAGVHAVLLGHDTRLAPGVYVLRLSALGRSASRTIAVVP
jgi:hypothetical protein